MTCLHDAEHDVAKPVTTNCMLLLDQLCSMFVHNVLLRVFLLDQLCSMFVHNVLLCVFLLDQLCSMFVHNILLCVFVGVTAVCMFSLCQFVTVPSTLICIFCNIFIL